MKIKGKINITEEEFNVKGKLGHREPHAEHHPVHPHAPVPPHLRKDMLQIEFTDSDFEILQKVFGDEDSAYAASEIILKAPPEIQILAVQIINMIEEVN